VQQISPQFTIKEVHCLLNTLCNIKKNNFGYWGLKNWPEINPRGVKDKIYLVLKEKGQPLHFVEVAEMIDMHGLSKKKAHPQTVHNELIKDERFVLIGRGIYALSDWGYRKGTVRDVITEILEKRGPLERKHVLEEVAKIRKVKKSTILINLNDEKNFAKIGNRYALKNK
jgi:DNA-directed RNA polymerase delta subunit